MKIKINKFMELSNISFETPAKIEAGHDVGKSTIFRAVLFAITGKDFDGKEFDGRIYPKIAKSVSDLAVDVEIEQSGVVFGKKANGTEKRQKGSDLTELQRSVTSVYSIDYRVVGKSEYDAKIKEVFGNFHLFCNPDHFRNLKKEDKRAIFESLVKLDKKNYFDGPGDKKTVSGKIKAQKDAISDCNSKLSELSKVHEPEKIEIVDYSWQLAELRKQRQDAEPKFSFLQTEQNNEIQKQISTLENSVFIPKELKPYFSEPQEPILIETEEIQKDLEKVQLSEPDTYFIDSQISRIQAKIKEIKAISLQIENYDDNVKNSKCTLCQVCTNDNCQFKRVELMPLSDLIENLSKLMTLQEAEESLNNLENEKINYLRSFDQKKESEILRLKDLLSLALDCNAAITVKYSEDMAEINEKNASIFAENSKIQIENENGKANFENGKMMRIAELKNSLHKLPAFDYSEVDEKINNLVVLQSEQQKTIDAFNEANGAYIYAINRIRVLKHDLQEFKKALIELEKELIKIEDAENRYYNDFENLINKEMPENVRVSLFKKNLSNDDYSECFEIEFNGSIYAGNGKTIAFYIWLCSWFQTKFEKSLPIFIDEAIILNEALYSNVKNTVILMRNDNCKTLKITNVN